MIITETSLCQTTAFGINSILYQRGIYPPETFARVSNYDMSLQLTTDPKLKNYLTNVVAQLKGSLSGSLLSSSSMSHSWRSDESKTYG